MDPQEAGPCVQIRTLVTRESPSAPAQTAEKNPRPRCFQSGCYVLCLGGAKNQTTAKKSTSTEEEVSSLATGSLSIYVGIKCFLNAIESPAIVVSGAARCSQHVLY